MSNTLLFKGYSSSLVVLFFLLVSLGLQLGVVQGQSPDVAATNRFAQNPVGLYSGIPGISLPVGGIDSHSLSVGLSMSYHAGGVKVEDYASSVGLGWSLSAGGTISRVVRGIDDFDTRGHLNMPVADLTDLNKSCLVNGTDQYNKVEQMLGGTRDSSPDIFYFTFPGGSGKFVFDNNGHPVVLDQFGLKIEKPDGPTGTWVLTTLSGTQYTFGGASHVETSNDVATAWYLKKITDLSGEVAVFNYEQVSFTQPLPALKTRHHLIKGTACESKTTEVERNETITTFYPAEIILNDSRIEFVTSERCDLPGAKKVDAIRIYHNQDELLKKISFQYECDASKQRLWLMSMQESGEDGSMLRPTRFGYYNKALLPGVDSYAQDHWGYYNAANNEDLVPAFNTSSTHFYDGANRDTDIEKVKYGVLHRIDHPQGSITEYDYESQQYKPYTVTETYTYEPVPQSRELCYGGFTECAGNEVTGTSSFSLNRENSLVQVNYHLKRTEETYNNVTTKTAVHIKNTGTGAIVFTKNLPDVGEISGTQSLTLPMGNYEMWVDYAGNVDHQNGGQKASISVNYNTYTKVGVPGYISHGGGLRVKKIVEKDGQGLNPSLVKRYEYTDPGTTTSSGRLMIRPQYYYYSDMPYYETDLGNNVVAVHNCTYLIAQSTSVVPLATSAQGGYVGYDYVTVYEGEEQQPSNGRVIYEYYNASDEPNYGYIIDSGLPSSSYEQTPLPGVPPVVTEPRKGYLKKSTVERYYQSGYYPVKETTYNYITTPKTAVKGWILSGLVDKINLPANEGCKYLEMAGYTYQSSLISLQGTTRVAYDGKESLTGNATSSSTQYLYNTSYPYLTREEWAVDGTGKTYKSKYRRVTDFDDAAMNGVVGIIKSLNQLGIIIDQQQWVEENGTEKLYGSQVTLFDHINNMIVPSSNYSAVLETPANNWTSYNGYGEPASPYELNATYTYDEDATLIEVTDKTGQYESMLYGYADKVAIARVSHAHHNQIAYGSFEATAPGNWENLDDNMIEEHDSKTGNRSYSGSLSKCCLPAGTYTVALWAKGTGHSITIAGKSKTTSPAWTYYVWEGLSGGSITINNTGALIDEVRLYPEGALMQTSTYKPDIGLTSSTGVNGQSVYYEYDGLHRKRLIKDQDGNIVSHLNYGVVGIAGFIEHQPLLLGTPSAFSFATSDGRSALDYSWDFGDGQAALNGQTVNKTYSQPGAHTVTLTISDGEDIIDVYTRQVYVELSGEIQIEDLGNRQVALSVSGSEANLTGTTYTWELPDDNTSLSGQSQNYQFHRLGRKTLRLVIKHPEGIETIREAHHLLSGTMTLAFNPTIYNVIQNQEASFSPVLNSNPPDAETVIDYGDGSHGNTFKHRYQTPGTYTVTAYQTHEYYAATPEATLTVNVDYAAPVLEDDDVTVQIDYQGAGVDDDIYTITTAVKYGKPSLTWYWEAKGDSDTWQLLRTGSAPQEAFTFPTTGSGETYSGAFSVRVRVKDANGAYSSYVEVPMLREIPN
ncbi:hypothetical protein GCM10009122_48220 [Fulvivirga kasyanovii]|uniref:PKD domain-containing protein n=1 Tax=Fulvivirga kasyanovii TaxID=396812 RepID=A0ABW9RX03_9BACT|nr:PKD domain-containing protein [Fulvivirga kasyanovii]MTI28748.1 PKD domain-containing protein [Fulvivirga kasyanovii]